MRDSRTTLFLLCLCQVLFLINNVMNSSLAALTGYALSGNTALATLPVTVYIAGAAITTYPASLWMRRVGRRAGFVTGSLAGFAGALLCTFALLRQDFVLFCVGAFLNGGYSAFGQYYRFAAAEAVEPAQRSRAIGLVLAGGIGGAILGPESAKLTRDLFAVPFAGDYLFLAFCALLSLGIVLCLSFKPTTALSAAADMPSRSLAEIAAQPRFIAAVLGAVTGYAVMSFLMTATPLAMAGHHFMYGASATIIEWHVLAMFAPSFFTGRLIQRFGPLRIMGCGLLMMFGTIAVAKSGAEMMHFWLALVMLGVGWNFLYIGATALLTSCYRGGEFARVQGLNDAMVFTASGSASFLSGVMLQAVGWQAMLLLPLPLLLLALFALLRAARNSAAEPRVLEA